jgi:hypothetical protein
LTVDRYITTILSMDAIKTFGLLGGAYKGGRKNLKNLLTHSAVDCGEGMTLCGKIECCKLADEYAHTEAEISAPPTCKGCLRKDPRF